MKEHPIKRLRVSVNTASKAKVKLTPIEVQVLVASYQDLWDKCERYREELGYTPADDKVKQFYGMDK